MKPLSKTLVALAVAHAFAFGVAGSATAQTATTKPAAAQTAPVAKFWDVRASKLIGTNVRNAQNESLGEIRDLVVDMNNGRVHYAILEFGGFLGFGEKLFAYPLSVFKSEIRQPAGGRDQLVLNVDKDRLKAAPGFDKNRYPDFNEPTYRDSVDRYFGPTVAVKPMPNMRLRRASTVIGKDINGVRGEQVGEVNDLVVDMTNGNIHYAVVEFDKAWSLGEKLIAVPVKALQSTADRDDLRIDVTREALANARGFERKAWPTANLNDPVVITDIDRWLVSVKVTPLPSAMDSAIYTRLDTNKDGWVSKEEAGKHAAVMSAWGKMDADNNGRITQLEFGNYERTNGRFK